MLQRRRPMRWKRKSGGVYWWDMKSSGIVDGMWNRLLLVRGGVNRWCWRLMVGWWRGSWDLAELRELGMKGFGGFFIYFLFFNTKPIRFASSNQTESKLKIKFRFGSTQPECPPQLRRKSPLIIIFFFCYDVTITVYLRSPHAHARMISKFYKTKFM